MITIKRDRRHESATLTIKNMTAGQALALVHALELHEHSPLAAEMLVNLKQAVRETWPYHFGDKTQGDLNGCARGE